MFLTCFPFCLSLTMSQAFYCVVRSVVFPLHSCEWMNIKFRDRSKVDILFIQVHIIANVKSLLWLVQRAVIMQVFKNIYSTSECVCVCVWPFNSPKELTKSRLIMSKIIFDSLHKLINKPDLNNILLLYLLMLDQHIFFNANYTLETDAVPALCFIVSKSLFSIYQLVFNSHNIETFLYSTHRFVNWIKFRCVFRDIKIEFP